MALSLAAEKAIRAEAESRGVDPDEAVAHARSLPEFSGDQPDGPNQSKAERPIADRLLIGFLPFIKVKELRSIWLGLEERIPDDELTCGEFQIKHGGAAVAPATPEAP